MVMNERIQSLYKQVCGKEWAYDFDTDKAELFARLIVQECAQLVQGVPTDTMGYHTADQKIKQHFGVE
jgi:hypothetical protein